MIELDDSQKAVLRAWADYDALSVFGAPGTGKTYTLRAVVQEVLAENTQTQIAVLTANRRSASELRNQLSLDLGGLGTGVQVRSITAFAFEIVSQFAQMEGRRPPELITGPDQDAIIKEAFDIACSGLPSPLDLKLAGISGLSVQTVNLPAFRADFRDLITRAAELRLSATDLKALSAQHGVPIWELGAQLMEVYEKMLAAAAGIEHAHADQVDHARLSTLAAQYLRQWREKADNDETGLFEKNFPHWNLILVDDVQNAPLSLLELLQELQTAGAKIVTFGDPDAAIAGYRGGVAHLPMLLTRARNAHGIGAKRINLAVSYRMHGSIGSIASRIQETIHTAGGGTHRNVEFEKRDSLEIPGVKDAATALSVENSEILSLENTACACTFVTERAQIAFIANEFNRLHWEQGVDYGKMAVITRSAGEHARLRRLFEEFSLDVEPAVSTLPLREAPLVREIISLIALAIGADSQQLHTSVAEVLNGQLFGYTSSAIRRIVQQLHGWELLAKGNRGGSEILEALIEAPKADIYAKIPELKKLTSVVLIIQQTHREEINVQTALWEIWDALDLAQSLQQQALSEGDLAPLANDALDAMLQLFRFAQRMVEREGESASLERLLELLAVQDLPEDSIAAAGSKAGQIALSTAASAAGKSWDYVAIVNLNDGSWPNRRMRNPLTQVPQLSSIVINELIGAQAGHTNSLSSEVVDDELRMFLVAVTRASKQLYLCAVESEDIKASAFLELVTRQLTADSELAAAELQTNVDAETDVKTEKTVHENQLPVLRHITNDIEVINFANKLGKLRQVAKYGTAQAREEAKLLIQQIWKVQQENKRKAPVFDQWIDELAFSTTTAVSGKPKISPSKVEKYLDCPLSAFYEQIGARAEDDQSNAREIGSLIHKIAELHPHGGLTQMLQTLDQIWSEYLPEMSESQSAVVRDEVEQMLQHYDEYALQTADLKKYSEISAKYNGPDYDVYARIDRIEFNPDRPQEVSVVDFKTGKLLPTKAKAALNPQLRVYQWLIDSGHVQLSKNRKIGKSVGARLIYLRKQIGSAIREQAGLDAETLKAVEDDLQKVAESAKGPQFLANSDSDSCSRCVFRQLCPAYEGKRVFS